MTNKIITLSLLLLLGFITTAFAHGYEPSNSCSKPHKPYTFNNEYEVNLFNNGVDSYKRCINNFIEEQNNESKIHLRAANTAIEEWNSFVNANR
ncbi:MAG: hypothetical protein WCK96_14315 [Methylococcales bacterium]